MGTQAIIPSTASVDSIACSIIYNLENKKKKMKKKRRERLISRIPIILRVTSSADRMKSQKEMLFQS